MRKLSLIVILLVSIISNAQNKQILYNFASVPQSLLSNPATDVKFKLFVGVPLLSGFSSNVGSSGFSVFDLVADDGVDFNTKLRNVVFSTSRKDHLLINEQLEIFSGGFKLGDWQDTSYLTFGLYQEFDAFSYFPKDYTILALDGNKDYLGKYFNLGDFSAKAELLSVFHLGYNKSINEKLILGVRGKIYSSIFNFNSTNNSGYFYTIPGVESVYEQVMSSDVLLNTSGFIDDSNQAVAYDKKTILKKTLLGGNLGLGLDLGITYYPQEDIQLTASIIDIGFINQKKDVSSYRFKGYFENKGLTPEFTAASATDNIFRQFQDAIPLDTLHTKYTTMRPIKFNSSVQYSFGDSKDSDCSCLGNRILNRNSVGAQLYMMSTPRTPLMAVTGYYRRRIMESLEMKATYTVDSYSYTNIGLGLSATIGKVNFYILADNLLEYRDVSKANSLSFQLGLNIVFAKSELD